MREKYFQLYISLLFLGFLLAFIFKNKRCIKINHIGESRMEYEGKTCFQWNGDWHRMGNPWTAVKCLKMHRLCLDRGF